jgi:hypothetical protein
MMELIFFYILQKSIQGYDSHFLCARVTVVCTMHIFWCTPAELCWRWSFMYSGGTFDLKNAPAKFMMQSCKFFPPNGGSNGSGCGNNHRKVNAMTMTTSMTADADTYANAPQQLQQQQQLPPQQWRNGKRWGVSTSKDLRGASFGYVGGKQRPGNGGNDNCSGIVPAAGKCGRDPGRAALPPLLPPPSPPRNRLLRGGNMPGGPAARRGAGQSAATKGEFKSPQSPEPTYFGPDHPKSICAAAPSPLSHSIPLDPFVPLPPPI